MTFVAVEAAGHMVPMDQPQVVRQQNGAIFMQDNFVIILNCSTSLGITYPPTHHYLMHVSESVHREILHAKLLICMGTASLVPRLRGRRKDGLVSTACACVTIARKTVLHLELVGKIYMYMSNSLLYHRKAAT